MKETLIVSGGDIEIEVLKNVLLKKKFSYIIAVDHGLEVLDRIKVKPNYVVGDFDSINKNILKKYVNNKEINIEELKPEKDYTDTHIAIKIAIKIKSTHILILGGIGSRLDHTIANIHILMETLNNNIQCKIKNKNNEIQLCNKDVTVERKEYKYISLIPLTERVEGITLKGFKYSLKNATLKIGESIGISNEQTDQNSKIKIKKGTLIIIQSND